jgi:3-deoxy-7-phosphoheptulonate synthase
LDKRFVAIVGPCSIHDSRAASDFAKRLKALATDVERTLFIVMRVFVEKSRSGRGWKGMLYDPHLDASNDMDAGLRMARKLLVELAEVGMPTAMELLDPLASYYFDDLLTWGIIGARTSSSQPHRQMASRLPFPVGFKNDCSGALEPAILGADAARRPHFQIGIDPQGHVSAIKSSGNRFTHIILRGSDQGPNCDEASVEIALKQLVEANLEPELIIDCSHGNSGRKLAEQKEAFISVIERAAMDNGSGIAGVMLESNLLSGRQPFAYEPSALRYGVSITDPCLSWEETETLIRWADAQLSLCPTVMSCAHN